MDIKILFDNNSSRKDLMIGWGFSCLVDGKILFDTGENGNYLINNLKQLNIDINKIQAAVISHDHWDHTGGLWEILKYRENLPVFCCSGFTQDFKKRVKKFGGTLFEKDQLTEISQNIFITGQIEATYNQKFMPEQSLVLKTSSGISIITGCAHPGIIEIVENVRKTFNKKDIYLVMGGFHLMETDARLIETIALEMKKMPVKKIGPCHCCGKTAEEIFEKIFGQNFVPISAGITITI